MTSFSAAELSDLFDDSEYGREKYTEPAPSDELVAEVEAELGYRLPAAYVTPRQPDRPLSFAGLGFCGSIRCGARHVLHALQNVDHYIGPLDMDAQARLLMGICRTWRMRPFASP